MAPNNIVHGPGSRVRPGSTFEVLADQPLDALRSPHAAAYGCVAADRAGESFVALISDPALPPRYDLIEKLAALQLNNVWTPLGWGAVALPGLPPNSFATVFERPGGARVVNALTETIAPFSADELLRKVLPPLVTTLRVFADLRLSHRAIRPTNLFYQGTGRQLLLGEAVSAPAGAAQPPAYETIEGGMALAHCRGTGTTAGDLYALGVTVAFLLLGKDPCAAIDPQELLRTKIERGSFTAVMGSARLPPEANELVRGLLADEVRERWAIDDLENWLQGRRLKPRLRNPSAITATRPFDFAGRACYTARSLAHAFAGDPVAAARAIRSNEFEIWLQRSLADEKRSVAVRAVRPDVSDSHSSLAQDLRLAARICIALDPDAPIRYGDFAAAIDTLGQALVAAFHGRGMLQTVGEILTARLPQQWVTSQDGLRPDVLALTTAKPFETLRRVVEDPRMGFGLERVLYELNPRLPCLSPQVLGDHGGSVTGILAALERVAAKGAIAEGLIDRHLAAYVAAHSAHIGRQCFDLLGGNPQQRVLGTLGVLAYLQTAHGPVTVPSLGKMIAPQAKGLVDMFHSRQRRTRLQAEVAKLAAAGSLSELYGLFQGPAEQGRDSGGFAAAQREYEAIEKTLAALRRSEPSRPAYAAELGGRFGVMAATCLATAIALIAVLRAW